MSTGTASRQSSSKPKKLKATCDFCSLSKVKCDRGHPQCLRCVKSGITCHYSESRRIGKAWQLHAATTASCSSPRLRETREQEQPTRHGGQLRETSQQDGRGHSTSPDESSLYDYHQPPAYTSPLSVFSDLHFQTAPSTIQPIHPRVPTEPYDHPDVVSGADRIAAPYPTYDSPAAHWTDLAGAADARVASIMRSCPLEIPESPPWDVTLPETRSNYGKIGDCLMKATTVLQVVHDPRTSCMRAESPPRTLRQTLDTTLDESRTAIETVREILDCPCARSIRVAIILVLITQQVMESYRTILTEHRSTPAAQCEKSLSGLNLSTSDIPMAIGRYHLDEEIRAKVIVQVLGCEMERIGSVLDILARYAKGMAQRPEELVLGSYIGSLQASRQDLLKSLQMSENC